MGLPTTGGGDAIGRHTGGGDLHHPPPEHGRTIHCNQAHCVPVSGGSATTEEKCVKAVTGE